MAEANESKQLKVGESFNINLKSRGALGLQMLSKVEPSHIATVERLDNANAAQAQAGDAMEAVYRVNALQSGKCTITFYETQPWNKDFPPVIQKEISLDVQ